MVKTFLINPPLKYSKTKQVLKGNTNLGFLSREGEVYTDFTLYLVTVKTLLIRPPAQVKLNKAIRERLKIFF